MSDMDVGKMMADLKRLAAQAQAQQVNQLQHAQQTVQGNTVGKDFSDLLQNAIEGVNDAQQASGKLKKAFEVGDPNVDLPQVMVASQKAGVAFTAMVEVRNKLVEAYKEVMSMPI